MKRTRRRPRSRSRAQPMRRATRRRRRRSGGRRRRSSGSCCSRGNGRCVGRVLVFILHSRAKGRCVGRVMVFILHSRGKGSCVGREYGGLYSTLYIFSSLAAGVWERLFDFTVKDIVYRFEMFFSKFDYMLPTYANDSTRLQPAESGGLKRSSSNTGIGHAPPVPGL